MKNKNTTYGVTFLDLLLLLFIALKLIGVINWTWFWVLSPVWVALLFFLIVFIIALLWELLIKKRFKKKV